VEAHIRDHYSEPLTLPDLCELSGLKARALQYAFQEKHALTPMAFLKIVRLNRARDLLRAADPRNASVTATAMQVGFWHLSQFACDYRWLFHELPNETLRQGKPIEAR
ncbi:MAG: helix-turn-helix domain-containing protein, partial [Gammaproteobacteria bacterium]|nr:helix-turn-helix domain-containing protein [Gammaproteobacteria bacterium]